MAVISFCTLVYISNFHIFKLTYLYKKIIPLKKLFFLPRIFIFLYSCFFQEDSTAPVYLRFPTIPQFTVFKAPDSTSFTRDNLKKNKPVVFMIFSPDCEHCQHETEKLLANIDKFKTAQIVMVTYLPYEEMIAFYKKYKIADYPANHHGERYKIFLPRIF